jgi:thiol-disulfide isomerase/thioredoxin
LVFKTTLRPDEDTLAVGRYALPEAVEGNDAELLLRAYRGCRNVEGSDACDQTYQANGGTLSVDHSGSVGARFAARLENVTFIEMQSDGSGPGGQQRSFCGSPLRLEATLLEPPAPPVLGNCLGEGEGSAKGDRLRDLVLPNCYGDLVALHDNCGQVKAQIIVLTAGWCAACRARLPQTETLVQQYKDQGQKVEAYYVLGQGTSRNAPVTQQECRNDAEGKGIDPARMLMDTDGDRTGFYETKHQGWADACDNGTPYYFVLDGDDMSYNFGSRCEDDPRAQQGYTVAIEELLAP